MKSKSGQVLVLVLLVVVVALSIGLSVASRNITNLKTATQSERSQRAFSAAEGGVEDILSRLNQVVSDIKTGYPTSTSGCTIDSSTNSATCPVSVGEISATVNVKAENTYESKIELGSVGQIDLKPADTTADRIRIDWSKTGASGDSADASIEVVEYFKTSAGSYGQNRWFFQGSAGGSNETGTFSSSAVPCSNIAPFNHCSVVNLQTGTQDFRVLRIRPFWGNSTVRVSAFDSGENIPLQTYRLESTASTSEGITRKVQVIRNALPVLPAAFDYALFSSGSITK